MKRLLPLLLLLPLHLLSAIEYPTLGKIERLDPALDKIVPPFAKLEKLCEGFNWSEGPVWKDGGLLFSDVPENVVYRWHEGLTKAEEFLKPSGLLTPTPGFREQGTNGLGVDAENRLILCEHGERRLARLNADKTQTALVTNIGGKRFNSPNDLAIRRNGEIYFTDPPYGLDKLDASPLKELPHHGIYRLTPDGTVTLLTDKVAFPNGIAFSPDEKKLYIGVSAPKNTRILVYDVQADGSLANERVFFNAQPLQDQGEKGAVDGLKVDNAGNVFASMPGGLGIFSPEGKLLGKISREGGGLMSNCAWGDDGSVLYITCDEMICRLRTTTKGPLVIGEPLAK